jgi:HK97 family phage major capsid protein
VPFSVEIQQDWADGTLMRELSRLAADARDNEDADKFVNGLPASNQPVGILSIGQTGALTTSQRVQTNTAATFALADVWKIKQAVPPASSATRPSLRTRRFSTASTGSLVATARNRR